jgi:enamine deaminase RidA (YjgF/YER057c/UK114 family)
MTTDLAAPSAIAGRLTALGIALPEPAAPAGAYASFVRTGNLVFVAGQAPFLDGRCQVCGKLGREVAMDEGQRAARLCALNILGHLRLACGGDLGRVRRVVSVRGFVNVAPGFTSIPEVIDGASRLLVEVFGPERGRHARTAIGAAELPSDVAVEVDAVFEVGGA